MKNICIPAMETVSFPISNSLEFEGIEIAVISGHGQDYRYLTDMLKANYGEFAIIKSQACAEGTRQ